MLATIKKSFQTSVLPWIATWLVYMVLYSMARSQQAILAGTIQFFAINGLSAIIAICFFRFWLNMRPQETSKRIFLFFALSYLFILIDGFTYHIMYNMLHIPHQQAPLFWVSLDNIAYIGYLSFQILAWTSILFAVKFKTKKSIAVYLPIILMLSLVTFIGVYTVKLDTIAVSLKGIFDFSDKLLEIGCLIAIAFCLAAAKNKGFFYLAAGFLINTVFGIVMNFGLFSQAYAIGSIIETGWVLSRLLMIYGLIELFRSHDFNNVRSWVAAPDSIRAQTAYWSFIVLMAFLVITFVTLKIAAPTVFF
jgi:hypothetical protein